MRLPQLLTNFRSLLLLALLLSGAVLAQAPLRVGVVVPGRATAPSSEWDELLAARAWEQSLGRTGVGLPVELLFEDGGTTAANTEGAIRSLIEQGVHAIVCCVAPASLPGARAASAQLPVLALTRPAGQVEAAAGPLFMPPGPLALGRAMTRHARDHGRGVGLMTLDNARGDEIAEAVDAGALEAGIAVTESVRYSPAATVLTPEALLVAASEPAEIIVWGLPGDSLLALESLEARGYGGPVIMPWWLAREFPAGLRNSRLRGAHLAAPPVLLGEELDRNQRNHSAVQRFSEALEGTYGFYRPTYEGAVTFDALELLLAAAEQAYVYGVDPGRTESFRQALADALVAIAPIDGAAGSYDFNGSDRSIATAWGIVPVEVGIGGVSPIGE